MKIIEVKNSLELSNIAAGILIDEIKKKPNLVVCFPTGKTPLGMYNKLVSANKKRKVDFSKIKTFNLDVYYPLPKKNRSSYNYYMFDHLFKKVNIKDRNINFLDSESKNPNKEAIRYESLVRRNPIDIIFLGVGANGHIGFNEPGSKKGSKTRLVNLTKATIERNEKIFKGKIPRKAITMGIKTILSSKKVILLALGKDKTKAITHLINCGDDPEWPVSFLKGHEDLIVIADREALKGSKSLF